MAQCSDELDPLLELVEQMYEECYRWRRRDASDKKEINTAPAALEPMANPELAISICPDLAAFTQDAAIGETQEVSDQLDPRLFDNKVVCYLRRGNFGFAAPSGSLAIVEALPGPVADRRLVIARHKGAVYARRFLRGTDAGIIGLTAEIPDPRTRTPKTIFLREAEVSVHQVLGVIFDHGVTVGPGQDEAVIVDAGDVLRHIKIAFRVVDDSAVPLALERQVVLGDSCIALDELRQHEGALVALTLDDGSSVFKRVGASLPGELAQLRLFESIGGLGSSRILSIGKQHRGFRNVVNARRVIGVLYRA